MLFDGDWGRDGGRSLHRFHASPFGAAAAVRQLSESDVSVAALEGDGLLFWPGGRVFKLLEKVLPEL